MLNKMAVVGAVVAVAGLGIGSAAWAGSSPAAPHSVGASVGAAAQGLFVPATAALTTASTAPTAPTADKADRHDRAGKAKDRKHGKHGAFRKHLGKVSHAQWVSNDRQTGAFVTQNAIRGSVTAVTSTSITVKAADGISETFTVNTGTKVRMTRAEKAAAGTIAQVKVGDRVGVLGTGTGPMTATHIADRGVPTAPHAPAAAAPTT